MWYKIPEANNFTINHQQKSFEAIEPLKSPYMIDIVNKRFAASSFNSYTICTSPICLHISKHTS